MVFSTIIAYNMTYTPLVACCTERNRVDAKSLRRLVSPAYGGTLNEPQGSQELNAPPRRMTEKKYGCLHRATALVANRRRDHRNLTQ